MLQSDLLHYDTKLHVAWQQMEYSAMLQNIHIDKE